MPVAVLIAGLLIVGCGGDGGESGNAPVPTTSATAASSTTTAVPRLACVEDVATFEVLGAPIGQAEQTHPSPDAAAQAEVDSRDDVESVVVIGEDPAGSRYALLDATGTVVEEVVFSDSGNGWKAVRYDSCG